MKRILLIAVLLIAAFALYWFKFRDNDAPRLPKQEALKTSRHSTAFNNSLDTLMNNYFELKTTFVEADSVTAKTAVKGFLSALDKLNMEELKKDTAGIFETVAAQLSDVKANAESLGKQPNITEMRQDFRMVSESLYPFLKSIHYEGKILYWQNCPMAFGEGKEANWISNTAEIVNPYMGKKHPEFKGSMLHCGEIKDSIIAK